MTPNPFNEDHLVEQPAMALLAELGWATACGCVFTLIQTFRIPDLLCDRTDVVVISDEAHRSQYDTLALNMRTALRCLVSTSRSTTSSRRWKTAPPCRCCMRTERPNCSWSIPISTTTFMG